MRHIPASDRCTRTVLRKLPLTAYFAWSKSPNVFIHCKSQPRDEPTPPEPTAAHCRYGFRHCSCSRRLAGRRSPRHDATKPMHASLEQSCVCRGTLYHSMSATWHGRRHLRITRCSLEFCRNSSWLQLGPSAKLSKKCAHICSLFCVSSCPGAILSVRAVSISQPVCPA